jgi:hypothetical protein
METGETRMVLIRSISFRILAPAALLALILGLVGLGAVAPATVGLAAPAIAQVQTEPCAASGSGPSSTKAQTGAPSRAGARRAGPPDPFVRTELFFGTNRPDRPPVSDAEWRQFLDREITPCFPDGLTVVTGDGQFRNADGAIIQERSIILILLYPVEVRRESSARIEYIREAYKRAFQQESVLRVDDRLPVWVAFEPLPARVLAWAN